MEYTPESVLFSSEKDLAEKFSGADLELTQFFSKLILDIYRDDTLAQVRQTLMEEATTLQKPVSGLAEQDSLDPRVRALARMRTIVKTNSRYAEYTGMAQDRQRRLQKWLKQTLDGDLAYGYEIPEPIFGEATRLAGVHAEKMIWALTFSPELQLKAVNGLTGGDPKYVDTLIVGVSAQEGRLHIKAWEKLLEAAHKSMGKVTGDRCFKISDSSVKYKRLQT